jgi:hypothetical protein
MAKMAASARETNIERCMVMAWSFCDGDYRVYDTVGLSKRRHPLGMREAMKGR